MDMKLIHEYTLGLLRLMLKGDSFVLPENVDFEELFQFSHSHGIENIVYAGLQKVGVSIPEKAQLDFDEESDLTIMMEAMQACVLEEISEAFNEAGIDYIPLKGSVIKYLYPMPDFRRSGDIDILVRAEDEQRAAAELEKLEFTQTGESNEIHTGYTKPPNIELELHNAIARYDDRFYNFCKNPWKYAVPKEANSHEYRFSNEFFYTHLIAHLCKHLYGGGAGLRLFADIYIIQSKVELNTKLLSSYLKKAKLTEINEMITVLINKWFFDEAPTDAAIATLEEFVLNGGSFGTREQARLMREHTPISGRMNRYMRKLFPSKKILMQRYPQLSERLPWIVMWFYRVYYMLRFGKDKMARYSAELFEGSTADEAMAKILNAVK